MRTSVSRISLLTFAFLAFFSCARVIGSQTVAQEKLAEVEKAIEAEMAATKTPGAAVAVISGDKVIFLRKGSVRPAWKAGDFQHIFMGLYAARKIS